MNEKEENEKRYLNGNEQEKLSTFEKEIFMDYKIPTQKEIYLYLENIGKVGYETQDLIGKSLLNQSNAILTVISIFSLIVLYIISFEIFNLEMFDKLYFMAVAYIPLFLSLSCAIGVQFLSKT